MSIVICDKCNKSFYWTELDVAVRNKKDIVPICKECQDAISEETAGSSK